MDFTRIFSLKSRATFFLLVAALCLFSVSAWWSVRLLVWSEVAARLVSDTNRIESALRERLLTHGNNLVHLRGQFAMHGVPSPDQFRQLVDSIDLLARYPGSLGLGYAPLLPSAAITGAVAGEGPWRHLPRTPLTSRGESAPVNLMEPLDWRTRPVLGYDLFSDERRRHAIEAAVESGDVSLSDPLRLVGMSGERPEAGFELYVALYDRGYNPRYAAGDPRGHAHGVLFTPFRARDFFEGAFGPPSLQRELVNFVVSVPPAGASSTIYNRFDVNEKAAEPWMAVERPISLFGQELQLRVYPLPHFYSFADRYLAFLVGLGATLLSCLIMIVMRVSQNQLEFETLAKEASIEAAQQSRRQIENLRRLNEFDRGLVGELDVRALVRKFATSIRQLTQVDASALFFRFQAGEAPLALQERFGLNEQEFSGVQLPAELVDRLFTQSLSLRRGAPGADGALKAILHDPSRYADWILAVVSTREGGRCGLLFAGRDQGRFSEVDREMLDSMISQFASGVEIAQLFVRTEDASRAKNAFLANMSHEIRTPLTALIGFSDMLTRESISPAQRQEVVTSLRKNGEQLTCIIDDILDLSKVEAGKLKIERQVTELAPLVHEIENVMDLRARQKGIGFAVEAVGRLPRTLETDEVRVKQILLNVVGNAIKFTEKGGVRLLVRHAYGEQGADLLLFTVKDTGIGISDEAQRELFRPFSQGDASNTRRYGGSGLGLALSRRLARELGGELHLIESIRGQGSTFELRVAAGALENIPWAERLFERAPTAAIPAPPEGVRLDGARLLVVEDSEDNQEIFRYFLEDAGADVHFVGDGLHAVQTAATTSFDMILMDIQIPGIDGKEATRRIRRAGYARPIVALTAHAMVEEQESCRQACCSGQITKPVSGELLVSRVAAFLGRT